MKRLYIIILVFFSANILSFGQNIQPADMLRFSQTYPWGSARVMGLNGAYGALGADQSSMSINPAGLGMFRTSDLSFSLLMSNNSSDATWGIKNSDFVNKLNISNIGYVFTNNTQKQEGWVSLSFGLAYNRLADFNQRSTMVKPKGTSSLLDEFCYYANDENGNPLPNSNLSPFYEGLAYDYSALDNGLFTNGRYHSDFTTDFNQYGQYQERVKETKGGIGEYALGFGANYSNKFYIGATLGIQDLYYQEIYDHTESTQNIPNFPFLNSFTFSGHFKTTGTGFNMKLGAILKPVEFLRLGFAIHTPTFYNINSEFYTSIVTNLKSNGSGQSQYSGSSDIRSENNSLQTPWKTILSAALVSPRFGLLSFDYELVNYTNIKITGDNSNWQSGEIKNYTHANNFRLGGELKLVGNLVARGGMGFYGTPYKDANLTGIKTTSYSAGLGFRANRFYADISYVFVKNSENYLLYTYSEQDTPSHIPTYSDQNPQIAKIDYNLNKIVATIGFKF